MFSSFLFSAKKKEKTAKGFFFKFSFGNAKMAKIKITQVAAVEPEKNAELAPADPVFYPVEYVRSILKSCEESRKSKSISHIGQKENFCQMILQLWDERDDARRILWSYAKMLHSAKPFQDQEVAILANSFRLPKTRVETILSSYAAACR